MNNLVYYGSITIGAICAIVSIVTTLIAIAYNRKSKIIAYPLIWLAKNRLLKINKRIIGETGIKFYTGKECAPGILCGCSASHEIIQRYILGFPVGKQKFKIIQNSGIFEY